MGETHKSKRFFGASATFFILILFTVFQFNLALTQGSSIVASNYYPEDGKIYDFVDHFTWQVSAVNTNTTVSVSIDGKSPITMTYSGLRNKIMADDTLENDWFTWEIFIPAVNEPGNHTFQFFNHYYVWQQADQYWAEYDSYTNIKSFTIENPNSTHISDPKENFSLLQIAIIAILSVIVILLILINVKTKKNYQYNKNWFYQKMNILIIKFLFNFLFYRIG